jgi:hypothetical protein
MTTFIDDTGKFLEKLYSNFLLRDLVYIVSGTMIIVTIALSIGHFNDLIDLSNWIVIFVVLAGYYIGILNQELWTLSNLFRIYPFNKDTQFVDKETDVVIKTIEINDSKESSNSLKCLERIIVIKTVTATFGSALTTSLIIFSVSYFLNTDIRANLSFKDYLTIVIPTVFFIISAICSNRRKAKIQDKIIDKLIDKYSTNRQHAV